LIAASTTGIEFALDVGGMENPQLSGNLGRSLGKGKGWVKQEQEKKNGSKG